MKKIYKIEKQSIEIYTTKKTTRPDVYQSWISSLSCDAPEIVEIYEQEDKAVEAFYNILSVLEYKNWAVPFWLGDVYLLSEVTLADDGEEISSDYIDSRLPIYPED